MDYLSFFFIGAVVGWFLRREWHEFGLKHFGK